MIPYSTYFYSLELFFTLQDLFQITKKKKKRILKKIYFDEFSIL